MKKYFFILLFLTAARVSGQNQPSEKEIIHNYIDTLTSPTMHGRGYVLAGRELASAYIQAKFRELKLKSVLKNGQLVQPYSFHVNAFPGKMELTIDGKRLNPGDDYLIDAASVSFSGNDLPIVKVDMAVELSELKEKMRSFDSRHAYLLQNVDSFCKKYEARQENLATLLPRGCYIMPQKAKLTWTVEQEAAKSTVFYVKEASLPADMKMLSVSVQATYNPRVNSDNIIGMVEGEVKDTFIVFSSHYDHLGMMGDAAYFPGASDNASGTSMMLYLASWFAAHPQHYSILFIAFSGEEVGLLGSKHYIDHPAVPLGSIKFLTNIDIMGDATDGVTVVNATEYPWQFALLNKINDAHKYIPIIKPRGKAANSDHYFFSENGVPAFFMYSNGGKGFYHDIFDVSNEVTLNNVDGVAKLLIDFVGELR